MKYTKHVGKPNRDADHFKLVMDDLYENHRMLAPAQTRLLIPQFKICPVCRGLSSIESVECVSCSWRGAFEHDPDHIEIGLNELMHRCPELLEALAPQRSRASLKWWSKFNQSIHHFLSLFKPRPKTSLKSRVDLRI